MLLFPSASENDWCELMGIIGIVAYPQLCVSCGIPDDGSHLKQRASFSHSTSETKGYGPVKTRETTTTFKRADLLICKSCMDKMGNQADVIERASARVPNYFGKLSLLLGLVIAVILYFIGTLDFTLYLLPSIPVGILLAFSSAKSTAITRVETLRLHPYKLFFNWFGDANFRIANKEYYTSFIEANGHLKVAHGVIEENISLRNYKDAPIVIPGFSGIIFFALVGFLYIVLLRLFVVYYLLSIIL